MSLLEFDADEQELQLFLAETEEHLQALDQHIVQLENTPDDQHVLQSIFRSAHTIKGGAGLIGHRRMADLAHVMENVLDALRSGTLTVTPTIIDTLLMSLDALRVLTTEVVDGVARDVDLDGIVRTLEACLTGEIGGSSAPVAVSAETGSWERDAELDVLLDGIDTAHLFDVFVSVNPDCGLVAPRLMQAWLELQRAARILRLTPPADEIEQGANGHTLRALVALEGAPETVQHSLATVADVTEARVTPAVFAEAKPEPTSTQLRSTVPSRGDEQPRAVMAGQSTGLESSIRISVSIVDDLMNLVSELVLGRTRLQTLRAELQQRYPGDETVSNLEDAVSHIDRISGDLQATVMKARMLPVENVFNKFPRLVRDLAVQNGKKVSFTMSGQDTELDRSVIEQLSDPLTHMLRNAIDHGMETPEERVAAGKPEIGSISLSATPCENHIIIEVRDDGRGIDGQKLKASAIAKGFLTPEAAERLTEREAIELIFAPGFSTARAITDISGRGVGMDIVKSTIERMGGHISITTAVGEGTTFAITLPLTLAIMQALLVSVDESVYALPLNTVTEILSIAPSSIQVLQGTEATLLRGTILPLVRLREFFGRPAAPASTGVRVVATRVDGQPLGLVVDDFMGEQEIVVKPLGTYIGNIDGLSGATILGDGRIGLLIDVAALKNGTPPSLALSA